MNIEQAKSRVLDVLREEWKGQYEPEVFYWDGKGDANIGVRVAEVSGATPTRGFSWMQPDCPQVLFAVERFVLELVTDGDDADLYEGVIRDLVKLEAAR